MTRREQAQQRERARVRMIRSADALERRVAEMRRSSIGRGELREACDAIEARLVAWWSGGPTNEVGLEVIAATLGVPVERLAPASVEDFVRALRAELARSRARMLRLFAADAEDYPLGRRPEIVADMVDRLWRSTLVVLGGGSPRGTPSMASPQRLERP